MTKYLAHPNAWWRETAQRVLIEHRIFGPGPVIFLKGRTTASFPAIRAVHALRTLEGLGALDQSDIKRALQHRHPFVREHALQLLPDPGLANDPDPHVRFQCALSLGDTEHPQKVAALATIASHKDSDRWTRAAVLSSAGKSSARLSRPATKARPIFPLPPASLKDTENTSPSVRTCCARLNHPC
jgi:hypothetical protein